MRQITIALIAGLLFLTGCARIDPFSPRQQQEIENQDGKIDEIKTNQNAIVAEFGKLRQNSNVEAEQLDNYQQGVINMSGDGIMISIVTITIIIMGGIVVIIYYRNKADKNERVAKIFAHQVAQYDDVDLDDQVFLAAMNTNVENEVYHMMVKEQARTGKMYRRRSGD